MSSKALGAAALAALSCATAAGASTRTSGGPMQVWAILGSGPVAKILFTGVIGDYGTATTIDKNGKVDQNGDYVRIKLTKGSFEVNSVALNKKLAKAPPQFVSKSNCSVVFGGSGAVTLFDGSGAYAGISGTLRITETFAGIGRRYTSGPKKGQCEQGENTQPLAFYGTVHGSGTVKFA
jgi:hypothetical protein